MKNKPSKKDHAAASEASNPLGQAQPQKMGVFKRFLAWIARGSKNTCPT